MCLPAVEAVRITAKRTILQELPIQSALKVAELLRCGAMDILQAATVQQFTPFAVMDTTNRGHGAVLAKQVCRGV